MGRHEAFAYPPAFSNQVCTPFSACSFFHMTLHSGPKSDQDGPNSSHEGPNSYGQSLTQMAQIPTKMAQILTQMAHGRSTTICVGMTVK